MPILVIIYMILGYWAAGKTIYANKVVIYSGLIHTNRAVYGFAFGWILIPIALLKTLLGK